MDFSKVDVFQNDAVASSLAFLPELLLCSAIVLMLFLKLFPSFNRSHMGWVAFLMTAAALAYSVFQWVETYGLALDGDFHWFERKFERLTYFGNLLMLDEFTIFVRMFLLLFTLLVILLTSLTGIPDRDDSADFYCLLLGSVVGMAIMASAVHLLMIYIGIEMASLPSYAMAGFLKGRRRSSEASLKYVVYGGGASGIMLYGISLIAGKFGTGHLPEVAFGFLATLHGTGGTDPILLLGLFFILVGIAFKLSAVPFHFWCPDVFEGASAEVAGFLSVASKGAALALLARVTLSFAGLNVENLEHWDKEGYISAVRYLIPILAFFAAITATFGNLAAYVQTNMKRLLAYSTIAHAGYMMMGLCTITRDGAGAVLYYLIAYLFMNLGAFAIVAFLRNQTGSEDLSSYRGLVRRSPWMVITLSVFLLSLLGIPPLAGFVAKFQIFMSLFHSGQMYVDLGENGLGYTMYALLAIGGINTVISAVYYVRVLRVMTIDKSLDDVEGRTPAPLPELVLHRIFAFAIAVATLAAGVIVAPLTWATDKGVARFADGPAISASDAGPPVSVGVPMQGRQ